MRKISQFYRYIKERVWFYPVLYGILAVLIAFLSISYDANGLGGTNGIIPQFLLTNLQIGETILGIVATSFITITTFTFSITMVVLTMYNSQYSPRVVRNFLTQRNTLQSFGVFVSGFLYVMIVFLFMSSYPSDGRIVSAAISLVYVLVGIVFFFRFINGVASYIQVSNLIERLKDTAYREIKLYKQHIDGKRVLKQIDSEKHKKGINVTSGRDGFVRELNYERLERIAKKYEVEIYFGKVAGQFVTEDTIVGWFFKPGSPLSEEEAERAADEIRQGVLMGAQRTETQDFDFTIQKIAELAIKALSPGINDPNTAIHCIRNTSVLLRELSDLPRGYIVFSEGEDQEEAEGAALAVCVEAMDFDLLLMNTYQQLIHYGKSDVAVIREIVKSIRVIAAGASRENSIAVSKFADYLQRKADDQKYDSLEAEILRKEMTEAREKIKF